MNKLRKPRIIFLDIETTPNLGYTWGKWEQDVIRFTKEWYLLSCSVKERGMKKVRTYALPDFPSYKKNHQDDLALTKAIWEELNDADIVVWHNGDQFDAKMLNTRFAYHRLGPPSPYKSIDTKKLLKKYFRLNSNKLEDSTQYFELDSKMDAGGFGTWVACMDKVYRPKAWAHLKKYNARDVIVDEQLYDVILPFIEHHPSVNVFTGEYHLCDNCGNNKQKRGVMRMKNGRLRQRYHCTGHKGCGAWSKGDYIQLDQVS